MSFSRLWRWTKGQSCSASGNPTQALGLRSLQTEVHLLHEAGTAKSANWNGTLSQLRRHRAPQGLARMGTQRRISLPPTGCTQTGGTRTHRRSIHSEQPRGQAGGPGLRRYGPHQGRLTRTHTLAEHLAANGTELSKPKDVSQDGAASPQTCYILDDKAEPAGWLGFRSGPASASPDHRSLLVTGHLPSGLLCPSGSFPLTPEAASSCGPLT